MKCINKEIYKDYVHYTSCSNFVIAFLDRSGNSFVRGHEGAKMTARVPAPEPPLLKPLAPPNTASAKV